MDDLQELNGARTKRSRDTHLPHLTIIHFPEHTLTHTKKNIKKSSMILSSYYPELVIYCVCVSVQERRKDDTEWNRNEQQRQKRMKGKERRARRVFSLNTRINIFLFFSFHFPFSLLGCKDLSTRKKISYNILDTLMSFILIFIRDYY